MASTLTDNRDIPLDIIHSILLKLPVKSLKRFEIVCKSWNAIISDGQFAKTHHQISKNTKPRDLFLCRRTHRENGRTLHIQLCTFKIESKRLRFKEWVLLQQPYGQDYVLCIGDGLILLSNFRCKQRKEYILWNPSSRKQTTLCCPYKWSDVRTDCGLCHDPNLDDYKVVLRYKRHYVVFSCKNKTWTEKQQFQYYYKSHGNAGLLVDGFCFWAWDLEDDRSNSIDIIYFDPKDDKFNKLQKPPELAQGAGIFYLTILKGCLCAYDNKREEHSTTLRVWIMKGHVDSCCWSELMNIQIPLLPDLSLKYTVRPMLITEKNERLISISKLGSFLIGNSLEKLPDLETHEISSYGVHYYYPTIPYLDTLFFPIHDDDHSIRSKRKRSSYCS